MAFEGFPKDGVQFLRELTRNNNRDWFQANKATFERAVKAPMVSLVESLNARLAKFAPDYLADPKKAIGRMNRDVRFSADKSPYKTEISAVFPRNGGEKSDVAGFWIAVDGEKVSIVGGVYMLDPDRLNALRRYLAKNAKTFSRLVESKPLTESMGSLQGERLQRPPKGFDADDPAVELLKYKQLYFWRELPAKSAESPKLLDEIAARFERMTPFVEFLDEGLKTRAPSR